MIETTLEALSDKLRRSTDELRTDIHFIAHELRELTAHRPKEEIRLVEGKNAIQKDRVKMKGGIL